MMSTNSNSAMQFQILPDRIHLDSQDLIKSAYDDYVDGRISYEEMDKIVCTEVNIQSSLEALCGVWSFDDVY